METQVFKPPKRRWHLGISSLWLSLPCLALTSSTFKINLLKDWVQGWDGNGVTTSLATYRKNSSTHKGVANMFVMSTWMGLIYGTLDTHDKKWNNNNDNNNQKQKNIAKN